MVPLSMTLSNSGAFRHKDTANCDTFAKIGTNEGHTMLIYLRPGGILGVAAFCVNLDKIQNGRRPKGSSAVSPTLQTVERCNQLQCMK